MKASQMAGRTDRSITMCISMPMIAFASISSMHIEQPGLAGSAGCLVMHRACIRMLSMRMPELHANLLAG